MKFPLKTNKLEESENLQDENVEITLTLSTIYHYFKKNGAY